MSDSQQGRAAIPPAENGSATTPDRTSLTPGTLYGVGVGPGSPDLLTLRAVTILNNVPVILAAASPKNEGSLAMSIAAPHLPDNVDIVRLDFPMTRDKTVLEDAWQANARTVATVLRSGRSAAFLTLGDPLIYSTFGYLMRTLKALDAELPVEVIPGITSYQEAAARTGTVLCEGEENLLLVSGINNQERMVSMLKEADSAVVLKTYKNSGQICQALRESGKGERCVFASRLGLEGERIAAGIDAVPEKPHYLSLLLAPAKR